VRDRLPGIVAVTPSWLNGLSGLPTRCICTSTVCARLLLYSLVLLGADRPAVVGKRRISLQNTAQQAKGCGRPSQLLEHKLPHTAQYAHKVVITSALPLSRTPRPSVHESSPRPLQSENVTTAPAACSVCFPGAPCVEPYAGAMLLSA
jgi:hypothetical protein